MKDNSIFGPLKRQEDLADRRYHQGLIIQPGALGDCVLTLPLAAFMMDAMRLQSLDVIGHSEHIVMFPGRTCVTKIRSMEAIPLHRLFSDSRSFDLPEHDPLIAAFEPYEWIVTFLGGEDTDFERNLIYTANCTSGTEVTSLDLKAPDGICGHISKYYISQFIEKNAGNAWPAAFSDSRQFIVPMYADVERGRNILAEAGLQAGSTVIIQPGSGSGNKNWPLENFISVASSLQKEGLDAAFLLGPAEIERFDAPTIEQITDAGKCLWGLSISDVIAVLSQAFAFLGNDSGITHLASSMGVATTVIFGPTVSSVYRPIGPKVVVFDVPAAEFAGQCGDLRQAIAAQILGLTGR